MFDKNTDSYNLVMAFKRIAQDHIEPYQEPTESEIRDAEKRHKEAFNADALVEMVADNPNLLLEAIQEGNKAAAGSILVALYNRHLDAMVEYSIYGRVLSSIERNLGTTK